MGSPSFMDAKEATDGKNIKDTIDSIPVKFSDRDPLGPVKLDALEGLLRTYLQVLPQVARRIDAIEVHLETDLPAGKPFIRASQRPEVGAQMLGELAESVRLLDKRLDNLESKLS